VRARGRCCSRRASSASAGAAIHAGGGQSHRRVAATARGQRERRLVGLFGPSMRRPRSLVRMYKIVRPASAVDKQAV
jgi:hypothetical protein